MKIGRKKTVKIISSVAVACLAGKKIDDHASKPSRHNRVPTGAPLKLNVIVVPRCSKAFKGAPMVLRNASLSDGYTPDSCHISRLGSKQVTEKPKFLSKISRNQISQQKKELSN